MANVHRRWASWRANSKAPCANQYSLRLWCNGIWKIHSMARTSEQHETQEIAGGVAGLLGLGELVLAQGPCRGKRARLLVQPGHRELQQLSRQAVAIALGHV